MNDEEFSIAGVLSPIQSTSHSVSNWYENSGKRFIDVSLSLLALVLCLPLLLAVSLLVVLTSPGPVLFTQYRYGKDNRPFKIFKFRTMVEKSEQIDCITRPSDLRLTAFGRLLRNTKIDELPQILNIIKGEMSIIGPRPLSVDESKKIIEKGFPLNTPGFMHTVKPGLIGLEQSKRTHFMDYAERFRLNYEYEMTICWQKDLMIFLVSLVQCRIVCLCAVTSAVVELLLYLVSLLTA